MKEEFYIGWEERAPAGYARTVRWTVTGLLLLTALLGALLAGSQRQISRAIFEWGHPRRFEGVLRLDPVPHLTVFRMDGSPVTNRISAPLVAPFKFGVNRAELLPLEGRWVTLSATRVERDGQLMLELEPGSLQAAAPGTGPAPEAAGAAEKELSLGRQVFRGEIVDSKCWMGVMNPGALLPHRACAVRCLSGGIPPMLLIRRDGAPPLNLLLVSSAGQPVNAQVLPFVAEPVRVTGELVRQNGLLYLRIGPAAIERIGR